MERKKTKLSMEDQPLTSPEQDSVTDRSSEETVQSLFNKKFVYPRNKAWSLASTSVIGSLMQIGVNCEHTVKDHQTDFVSYTVQDKVSVNLKMSSENIVLKNCRPSQEITQKADPLSQGSCPENVGEGPVSSPQPHPAALWSSHSTCLSPQLKSPRYLNGRQYPPNKFRRKTASMQRLVPKMVVSLPLPWRCEKLIAEKDKLNGLKDQLSDKEMISWHQHTNFTNMAGKIVGEVKTQYGAELCTQAWCKFHEVLGSHDVLPPLEPSQSQTRLNTVHLCEAPGAFITSLNHFLVCRGVDTRHRWRWLGTTLNPYYEGNDTGRMISDDRFIRTTFANWFFGTDNSGDLMSLDNMLALMDRAQRMGDIHLVTADGSIDCQENPAEQEVIVSRLHHCEVLCSCLLLAPEGSLVIKLFTMFEASSIVLLYFLNCVFQQVTVCKPATSKSGNSEVYAVCTGYTASLSHDALLSLFAAVCSSEDPHVVLLPKEDIPEEFMAAHIDCCLYFCRLQSDTISRNLRLYDHMTDAVKTQIVELQELCVDHFVQLCQLQEIEDKDRIRPYGYKNNFTRFSTPPGHKLDGVNRQVMHPVHWRVGCVGSSSVSLPLNRRQGTFHQRQQHHQFPWQQQLEQMQDYVADDNAGQKIKRRQKISEETAQQWRVLCGQGFESVASSYFVDGRLVADLHAMMQHAQVDFHQQKSWAHYSTSALEQAVLMLHDIPHKNHHHHHQHHHHHHHHHHHSSAPSNPPPIVHLPLEGSLTGFWPSGSPELSPLGLRRLDFMEELVFLDGAGVVGVVVDVTCPRWMGTEEVGCQRRLVEVVHHICSYLQFSSSVALILPLALTRLTAGLIYIMATLFQETSFAAGGQSAFLYQTLIFHHFSAPSYPLLTLLESLRHSFPCPPRPARSLSFPETSDSTAPLPPGGDGRAPGEMSGDVSHLSQSMEDKTNKDQLSSVSGTSSSRLQEGGRVLCGDESCDCVEKDTCPHCIPADHQNVVDCTTKGERPARDVQKVLDHQESVPVRPQDGDMVPSLQTMRHDVDGEGCVSHDVEMAPCPRQCEGVMEPKTVLTHHNRTVLHDASVSAPHDLHTDSSHNFNIDRQATHDIDTSCEQLKPLPCGDTESSEQLTSADTSDMQQATSFHTTDTQGSSCAVDLRATHHSSPGDNQQTAHMGHHTGSTDLAAHHGCECEADLQNCNNSHHGGPCEADSQNCNSAHGASRHRPLQGSRWSRLESQQKMVLGNMQHSGSITDVGLKMVPLEIVPMLDLINDVTFTRFLQASNGHSVTRFLAALKLAEQQRLTDGQ